MIRKYYVFNFAFLFFCSSASALNINTGVSLIEGHYSDAQEEFGWSLDDISPNHNVLNRGYTNRGTGNIYYALYSDMYIRQFDVSTKQYLGHWPLARWPHQYFSPAATTQYKELFMEYPLPFNYEATGAGVGCYGDTPLRYGDIENDSKKELVIILDRLFMIFSLEHNRVVFAEYLDASDWLNDEEEAVFFEGTEITASQYVSRLLAENDTLSSGVRVYTKLYFGDFDEDGNYDILAWRKSYRSNAVDNPIKGFSKINDNWQHFERDLVAQEKLPAGTTGEYLPQATDTATIQSWLTDNNLTWQKGYPSQSECAGQEGQLIPEMHDPLLNDADVLE